jgi:hypothetical protein
MPCAESESLLNPNAGTRTVEETKTNKYKLLCQQRGMDFVPIVFTARGGMGEQLQRRYWNPPWIRVAEEDEACDENWTAGPSRQEEEGILGGQIRGRGCTV